MLQIGPFIFGTPGSHRADFRRAPVRVDDGFAVDLLGHDNPQEFD
jgi:hypothetical protein